MASPSLNLQQEDKNVCSSSNGQALSGFIIQVNEGSFRMLVDGQVFNVIYSPCTQGLSNIKNYSFAPGDITVAKGEMKDSNTLNAFSISTIHN